MTTAALFQALQSSPLSISIAHLHASAGAIAQLVHIVGFLFILTAVLIVNLRLIGLGLSQQPLAYLAKVNAPLVHIGLGLVLISGLFIFLPSAALYFPNPAFWLKFVLLGLALIVQWTLFRVVTRQQKPSLALAWPTAFLSLGLWFGVAFAGRAIGFLN